jgi:hypothetical protein
MIFRPTDGLYVIKKRRDTFSLLAIFAMLAAIFATRCLYIYFVHFPLAATNPVDAELPIELGMIILPLLVWGIASYAISSVLDGETKIKECFAAALFSMMPYVLLTCPSVALSRVMGGGEGSLFYGVQGIAMVWSLLLVFYSFKELNSYSLKAAVGVALLSVVLMLVIVGVALLLFALGAQFVKFVSDLMFEIDMNVNK